ncbi:outer membrane protein assembly factor BamB family protein [Micromonospora deserti]|uniref:outer membrane protein assembly factor BamB family protein n=1 Tax=Micromonospora deserti TaxID=2070366 RepID=UPI0011B833CE|nr:PQQ-binding-like beta-propeller repeat protein [Micromonospora deserti]
MALIDLGELRDESASGAPSRRPRPVGRPLRIVLVLALVLAVSSGAGPAPGRVAAVVPGSSAADAFLAGDRLYVAQPAEGVTGGSRDLLAYRLPDRATAAPQRPAPLWRVPALSSGRIWQVQLAGGAVLLSAASFDGTDAGETIVFDADTGRARWRQPGFARLDAAGRLLVETVGMDGPGTVRSVDPATGRTLWSLPVPPEGAQYRLRDGVIEQLVLITAGGAVAVHDAGTGALLRRADLPTAGQHVHVVGDLLLVVRRPAALVTAYELDGLRRRWEASLPPLMVYLHPCGDLLCVAGEPGGIQALDPATGRVQWTGERLTGVLPGRSSPLLALTPAGAGADRIVVLDMATGRELADLGAWQLVPARAVDERAVGVRPVPGGLLVAELNAATGRARGHDVLRGASGDCQIGGDALVCRRRDGGFGVWRLRD